MSEFLPDKESLLNTMEVVTTAEAAEYFYRRFAEKLKATKMLESSKDVLEKVLEFVDNVRLCDSRQNSWRGGSAKDILTDFQNLQQKLAETSLQTVTQQVHDDLRLDIAVSDIAQLLRGYSTDGVPLEGDLLLALDRLFNAWLANNDMISKGSTIYVCDEHGEIKMDARGQPVKVQAERVRQLIDDQVEGFATYITAKGMPTTVVQHEYPEQAPISEPAPEAATEGVSIESPSSESPTPNVPG